MEPTFRVYFNRRKQWVNVYLDDVHPDTFARRGGGRWGYYVGELERTVRRGLLGAIHLIASRVRPDLVVHEVGHGWLDALRERQGSEVVTITPANEEKCIALLDEMVGNYYREYERRGRRRRG